MSYFADLRSTDSVRFMIGWLEPEFPYAQGEVAPEFTAKLGDIARRWGDSVDALNLGVAMGYHTCGFCKKAYGSGTFGVPSGDKFYFCPELITHYVEHHGYAPPAEFVAAVLACPLPGTSAYAAAVAPIVVRWEQARTSGESEQTKLL